MGRGYFREIIWVVFGAEIFFFYGAEGFGANALWIFSSFGLPRNRLIFNSIVIFVRFLVRQNKKTWAFDGLSKVKITCYSQVFIFFSIAFIFGWLNYVCPKSVYRLLNWPKIACEFIRWYRQQFWWRHHLLVSLLLTLHKFQTLFWCSHIVFFYQVNVGWVCS